VKEEAFVLISEMHCLGEQIHSLCRGQGFQPRIVCRSSQIATVHELVGLGQGISLLPQMACQPDKEANVVYRVINDISPNRTIIAVRHGQRYELPQARQFIRTIKMRLSHTPTPSRD
jgi:LysR family hydrogen peroxide-inducible transcriptional activator